QNAIISQHLAQLALLTFREQKSRARLQDLSNRANACITEGQTELILSGPGSNNTRMNHMQERDNHNFEFPNTSFSEHYSESMTRYTTGMEIKSGQLLKTRTIDSQTEVELLA